MALIVQKFGGTSVGSVERIRQVAEKVKGFRQRGDDLVVVVSAMSGETNRLIDLARQIQAEPDARELDVIVSTGEQVTIGLLAMALKAIDVPAVSYTGAQVRIVTDSAFNKARIQKIDDEAIRADLSAGKVVIVAGFQGVDEQGNITTLGRGGSDTTGVALAAALKADECQIYTDVDGVYTTDPRVVESARRLDKITFEEMLEMASLGSKVLQIRSVGFAKKYNIPVHVRSSFSEEEGTMVVNEDSGMEQLVVSGVTHDLNQARITLKKVPDQPGIAAKIFGPIAENGIVVDMIIQNISEEGRTDLTFSCPTNQVSLAEKALADAKAAGDINFHDIIADQGVAKVSVVGIGMRSHAGVAAKMFSTLRDENINIKVITTSEIKISVLIDRKYMELAVQALHDVFGLEAA